MLVQQVPDGLEEMSPGPELAGVLATLDIFRVASRDLPVVLRARSRQRSHDEAEFLRIVAEMGRRDPFDDTDMVATLDEQARYAADELRVALLWTRRGAEAAQCYADHLVFGLSQVHAALSAGRIDPAKARVFHRHLLNLPPRHIESICARFLPIAGTITTGQLAARLAQAVIAIDPTRAREEYERAVSERAVVAYLNPDGTVTLTAQGLPADEAAAACERIHQLAKQVKLAGHPGKLDQIKADVVLGLLNRRFDHMTTAEIVTVMTSSARPAAASDTQASAEPGPRSSARKEERTVPPVASPQAGSPQADSHQADSHQAGSPQTDSPLEARSRPDRETIEPTDQALMPSAASAEGRAAVRDGRITGVEVSVQLATLLGRNEHPATIPGLGPVQADIARRIVACQRRAQWRYTLVDSGGHFVFGGITRRRPASTSDLSHSGIVDLIVPLDLLDELAGDVIQAGDWGRVVVDIVTQYRDHEQRLREMDAAPRRRFPSEALRRHIQQRDQTCVGPGCRRPATRSEFDHSCEYRYGGLTTSTNGGPACEHDHDLKTKGGWRLDQPSPGEFVWRTSLGQVHRTRGEPILYQLPEPAAHDNPPF